jgi:hypothetical protein
MNLREIGDELLHLELKEKYFKKILRISRLLCASMGDGEERKCKTEAEDCGFMDIQELLTYATEQKELTWKGL